MEFLIVEYVWEVDCVLMGVCFDNVVVGELCEFVCVVMVCFV